MGKFCGSFRLVLQVASVSLMCLSLRCEASAQAEPCEQCAAPTIAESSEVGKTPPNAAAPLASEQLTVEKTPASAGEQTEPADPPKVENNAIAAALADGVATKLALAAGAVEGNAFAAGFPLGLVALTGAKVLIVKYAETLPEHDKRVVIKTGSAAWGGAAVNNLLVMLAAPTPVAILAGVVMGIITWRHTAAQYDNQDRVAALQKERQERLAAMPKEKPALSAPFQANLEMPQTSLTAAK